MGASPAASSVMASEAPWGMPLVVYVMVTWSPAVISLGTLFLMWLKCVKAMHAHHAVVN